MRTLPDTDRRLIAAAVASLLAALGGCASSPPKPVAKHASHAPKLSSNFASVRALSIDQLAHVPRAPIDAPPPPGLDADLAQPVQSANTADATASLADVITRLTADRPAPVSIPPANPRDADTALRLYITGREKLVRGDTVAIQDLTKTTELDPAAPEPWRELAEAQAAVGRRTEAEASFQKALDRGLEDARILERLGRAASDRADHARAAALLARASRATPERADPLLPSVIDVALSRALTARGFITAGRDAMLRALARSSQFGASTRYGEEFGAIIRRQGDLWREVGDCSCRLNDFPRAAEAYTKAIELPSLESRSLLPRLVWARVKSGRPAAGALAILDDIAHQGGRISDEQASLLSYIARQGGLGPRIARDLEQYRAALPTPLSPSVASGLTVAAAAVLPPADRARALRDYLATSPTDTHALAGYLDSAANPTEAVARSAALIDRNPAGFNRIAESLLATHFEADQLHAAAVAAPKTPSQVLLAAAFCAVQGRLSAAADLARQLPTTGPLARASALCRVEIGAAAGLPALWQPAFDTLRTQPGIDSAHAFTFFQRNREALAALEPSLTQPSSDIGRQIESRIFAADLAVTLGRADDAQRWLDQAAHLDPLDERAPARQLGLYGPGGPKTDSGLFNQTLRTMRRDTPDSRTLRGARAKELFRRAGGLQDQAESEARALAEEEPGDASALDLLVSIWKARAAREGPGSESLTRARDWLESRLARRPGSPPLLASLAAVLSLTGHAEDAESRIRSVLEASGGPDVSRILEKILRDELHRPQEADALTLARLQGRPPLPREAPELAECHARNGDDAAAAADFLTAFPPEVSMTPDQAGRLLLLTASIAQRAITQPEPDRRRATVQLFDLASDRAGPLTPEMHDRRIQVLALWPEADATVILNAAALAAQQHPRIGSAAYIRASSALTAAGRGPAALVLISKAADQPGEPTLDLLMEWTRDVAASGTIEHARLLIERADAAGKLNDLIEKFEGPPPPNAPARNLKAQAAYLVGNLFASDKRPDRADAAYELALTYDANHAWSLNNLGYSLLEKGTDLGRASDLLERAHAALPDEGSITDSLGWLRYKQAVIEDVRDAAGLISKRGAVSLLQSATMTDRGRTDPTILNHLADALWLAGRSQEAQRYWDLSDQVATRLLNSPPRPDGGGALSPAVIEEYQTIKQSALAKRRAAMSGGQVRVAPQIGNPDPKPQSLSTSPPAPTPPQANPANPAKPSPVDN